MFVIFQPRSTHCVPHGSVFRRAVCLEGAAEGLHRPWASDTKSCPQASEMVTAVGFGTTSSSLYLNPANFTLNARIHSLYFHSIALPQFTLSCSSWWSSSFSSKFLIMERKKERREVFFLPERKALSKSENY